MSLKVDKRCKVCTEIKQSNKLLKRIYDSKQFVEGGESLRSIALDYQDKFSYQSLYNHSRYHQRLNEDDIVSSRAVMRSRRIEADRISTTIKHTEARKELVAIGMEGVRDHSIRITGTNLVALLGQEAAIEEKAKDREFEVYKMIQDYASGAITEIVEGEVFDVNE